MAFGKEFYFIISAGGEVVSAEEKEFMNSTGQVIGRMTPEYGAAVPFRSLILAMGFLRERRTPGGRYSEGSWRLRKGLGYGYIAEWVSDKTMPSGSPVKTTYTIIPTPRY